MNIFITGGSRGIGKAIVKKYAEDGHNLYLYARIEDNLIKTKEELNSSSGKIEFMAGDVTDFDNYGSAIEECQKIFGSIDLAILNAGLSRQASLPDLDFEEFEYVMQVNFMSYVFAVDKLSSIMLKQGGGTIAGVSSIADIRGFPGSGSYNASKAALTIFLESARVELHNHNIKVLTIRPGFVKTDLTDKNKFYMPFLMNPDKAANIIIKKIKAGKSDITFPFRIKFLSALARHVPDWIFNSVITKTKKEKLFVID